MNRRQLALRPIYFTSRLMLYSCFVVSFYVILFHPRLSSIEVCLPSRGSFHARLSSIKAVFHPRKCVYLITVQLFLSGKNFLEPNSCAVEKVVFTWWCSYGLRLSYHNNLDDFTFVSKVRSQPPTMPRIALKVLL